MRQRVTAIVVGLLLAGVCPAAAQQPVDPTTLSLEDLMATPVEHLYGASKFLQKVSDAPAAVTIITAEEIELYGYRTLADVLRAVEGISISYDRNYSYLGMRGLSRPGDLNSRVLVLVNGHRMNNNIDDQANLGTDFQIDAAVIERVEVIRGPSAALYGATAFAAVVAVVTKPGHKVDGVEVATWAASQDTTHGRVTWGTKYANGVELLASGTLHRSGGAARLFFPEFDGPATNRGYADGADGDKADNLLFSATRRNVTFLGLYAARTKDVPTASFNTAFNSGREQTSDRRTSLDVQYTRDFGRSGSLLARAYADRYAYDGRYPYLAADEADASTLVLNRDRFRGLWWGGELDLTRRLGRAHRITLGTEFRHNVEQTTLNYDEEPRAIYIDHRPRSHAVAVNLQDEYEVTRWLRLNLAVRAERLTTGAGGVGPKAALILTPASDTTIKLLFSRALRAPSAYERFYDSPSNVGNTELTAERMEGLEVNLEHYLTPAMKVEASVFRNTYRNLIIGVADADGAVALRNGLDVRAPGLELSWRFKDRAGVQARASYSALFDADAASQAWTSGAPKHLAKLSAGRSIASLGLTIGGELQYESVRQTHTGEVLPSAVVANVTVVRSQLLKGVDLNVSLFNLFDQRYSEPVSENHLQGGVLQDGRQFLVGLTWRVR